MKKFILYLFLFLIPFVLVTSGILSYFKIRQNISNVEIPDLPKISFNDLIKYSRFSLEKAPTQSLVGNISQIDGDVLYEKRLATESAKIDKPQEVQQGESIKTGETGGVIINFKDAAEIKITYNSGIDVIQTLPANLVFRQTLGSVSYKKLGQIPVSVRVGHLLLEVSGELNVSFTKDSPVTTIDMTSGTAVVAYNDLNNNSQVINLSAGQTYTFNEANRKSKLN